MPAASLNALLTNSIDYAGMFPPCSLGLEPALKNHAQYVHSADRWMLGGFVLPIEQFDAAKQLLSEFDPLHALRIAVLGPRTATADAFLDALDDTDAAIRSFARYDVDLISINHLEMLLPPDVDLGVLKEARAILGDLPAFWEAPPERAQQTIALVAGHNSDEEVATFGYKLRTGGVTADAFPDSIEISAAVVAAMQHHVPIKFTAGLHHPIRQFHASVQAKMHGFLNVLGAGVLAIEHGWSEGETADMLNDERAESFSFDDASFAWREWEIATDRIRMHRKLVTSFGSCSFDEPRDDLRALKLL